MIFTFIKPLPQRLLFVSVLCCFAPFVFGQKVEGEQSKLELPQHDIHWYKPLSGGPLKMLVILPADNANELDELSTRMDIVANVIETSTRFAWHSKPSTSPQDDTLTHEHLALTNKYDCILIGKIAWDVIPRLARDLILKHVEQGSGLVYVSPYLHDSTNPKTNSATSNYKELFRGPDKLGLYRTIYSRTAYAFSQLVYYRDRLVTSDLPALPRNLYRQSPFYLSSLPLGKGRVIALDYDDTSITSQTIPALVPFVDTNHFNALTKQIVPARRDLWMFGLTMAIMHASNRYSNSQVSFLIKSVVPTPLVDRNHVTPRYLREMNPRQFYRYRLPAAEYYVVPPRADEALKTFYYRIRSSYNQTIVAEQIEISEQDKLTFKLPMLEQGHYLLDGFYLDKEGRVINSGNTSIRVVSVSKIRECTVPFADLRNKGTANCELILSQHLTDTQHVDISLTNIAGEEIQKIPFLPDAFSRRFSFSLISRNLPSLPFVLRCTIVDGDGVVVRHCKLIEPTSFR
jgi:hypothetical protein